MVYDEVAILIIDYDNGKDRIKDKRLVFVSKFTIWSYYMIKLY